MPPGSKVRTTAGRRVVDDRLQARHDLLGVGVGEAFGRPWPVLHPAVAIAEEDRLRDAERGHRLRSSPCRRSRSSSRAPASPPRSPSVAQTRFVGMPRAAARASTPPTPNDSSSGWAKIASRPRGERRGVAHAAGDPVAARSRRARSIAGHARGQWRPGRARGSRPAARPAGRGSPGGPSLGSRDRRLELLTELHRASVGRPDSFGEDRSEAPRLELVERRGARATG